MAWCTRMAEGVIMKAAMSEMFLPLANWGLLSK